MVDAGAWALAAVVLALVLGWGGWWVWRSRHDRADARTTRPMPPPVPPAAVVRPLPAAISASSLAPRPPPGLPPQPTRPPTAVVTTAPPAPAVLAVGRADAGRWQAARSAPLLPEQAQALGALLGASSPASQGLRSVDFGHASALQMARAEARVMATLAHAVPLPSGLTADAAAALAGTLLEAWAQQRYLNPLAVQLAEAKLQLAALPPKLVSQTDDKLKTLTQEFSRLFREAQDAYVAALRKPLYLQRIDEACLQSQRLWQTVQQRLAAARDALDHLRRTPHHVDVRLEKTLTHLRELQGQRRVQELAARLVGGLHVLRLALGGDGAAAPQLSGAARELAVGHAGDTDRLVRVADAERVAQCPDEADPGEFGEQRASLRKLLARLQAEPKSPGQQALEHAASACAAGFLDGQELHGTLMLRLEPNGHVGELRFLAQDRAR